MGKTVYLAGPINSRTDLECKVWRSTAAALLAVHDIVCINPMERDYRGREDAYAANIVAQDKEWIRDCTVVLLNANSPSWGTAMECFYAASIGKPVVSFATHSLATAISPWLRCHSSVYDSLWSAIDGIVFGSVEGMR